MSSVYFLNKGVEAPLEFKGLQAQYLTYLAVGLLALLLLFVLLYTAGVNPFFCLLLVGILGSLLVYFVSRCSHKYGRYGLMKKRARKALPGLLCSRSRKMFVPSAPVSENHFK